jgi:hypothetical protein
LQPLDGSATRAWQTPNPWNEGRFCQKKVDQEKLLSLNGKPPSKEEMERTRLKWAQHRLEERRALVAAHAEAGKPAPPKITNGTNSAPSHPNVPYQCKRCGGSPGAHFRHCMYFVEG